MCTERQEEREYIDLMLIHGVWTLSAEQAADVWRGLIDAKAAGKVRHIGVSNFERSDLEKLIDPGCEASSAPARIPSLRAAGGSPAGELVPGARYRSDGIWFAWQLVQQGKGR